MRIREMSLLFEALTEGVTVQELIKIGHQEIFKNPIMITNAAFRVIAMERETYFEDKVWDEAALGGSCSNESIESFRKDSAADKLFYEENAFIYDWNLGEKIPRILARIEFKKHIYGYVIIFAVNHPFEDDDLELTNMFCQSLRVVLNAMKDASLETSFSEQLFMKLLNNHWKDEKELNKELELAHWRAFPHMKCYCIEPSVEKNSEYYRAFLKREIQQLSDQAKSVYYQGRIAVLYQYVDQIQRDEFDRLLSKILHNHEVQAGKSEAFHDFTRVSCSYQQSLQALESGKKMEKDIRVHDYKNLFPYAFFSTLSMDRLEMLLIPEYKVLVEFDGDHKTDMCQTLATYYFQALNIKKVAKTLHAHRNTITYRLAKIEKLLDLDIYEISFLERFAMAYRVNCWLEKVRPLEEEKGLN